MHNKLITEYVSLSHLRSKGKASAYILYCTGSGMLTRYCTDHSAYTAFLKVPKIIRFLRYYTLSCMFVYIKY